MPIVDDYLESPNSGPPYDDAANGWVVPFGSISGLRLYLSYSVFVAIAFIVTLALFAQGPKQLGNGDLVTAAAIGIAFWSVGWLVQISVYAFYRFTMAFEIESLTIGLLGVESRVRSWDAPKAFAVSASSLLCLAITGGFLIFAEQLVNGTDPWSEVFSVWRAPSFGLGAADHVWIAGAWLIWLQAICQAYPLPKSTGRIAVVSSVSLLTRRLSEPFQTHFSRRVLQIIAMATALVAAGTLIAQPSPSVTYWPILLLLSVALWYSAKTPDVQEMIVQFGSFDELYSEMVDPNPVPKPGLVDRAKQAVRSAGSRRKLRRAIETEHREAMDADQLDDVLQKLHEQGRDSLSDDEIDLLERVSENLRRQREREVAERDDSDDSSYES